MMTEKNFNRHGTNLCIQPPMISQRYYLYITSFIFLQKPTFGVLNCVNFRYYSKRFSTGCTKATIQQQKRLQERLCVPYMLRCYQSGDIINLSTHPLQCWRVELRKLSLQRKPDLTPVLGSVTHICHCQFWQQQKLEFLWSKSGSNYKKNR